MMRRRPNALLHRAEVDTLARLRRGRTKVIRREHEDLLISMGLVQISENGRLRLTKDGLRRLNEKGGDCLPTVQKKNPFSPQAAQLNPFDPPSRALSGRHSSRAHVEMRGKVSRSRRAQDDRDWRVL